MAAVVQWSRRLTAQAIAALPPDQLHDDMRVQVYACGAHAITLDLAAHVHLSSCSGPNSAALPVCDCTPEPVPTVAGPTLTTLPTGWQVP